MSIRPITPTRLNVLIPEAEEFGFGEGACIQKSFTYAKDVIIQKTWDNLLARVWEAITHVFCQQKTILDLNPTTQKHESKLVWTKEAVTTEPKITFSLNNLFKKIFFKA